MKKIQPLPDPREERELARQLDQALRSLDETPPPSLEPDQITAWLQEESSGVEKGRRIRRWAPLLAGCAALLLLLLPLSRFYPHSKSAVDSSSGESGALQGDPEITLENSTDESLGDANTQDSLDSSTALDGVLPPQNGQFPVSQVGSSAAPESEALGDPQRIASAEAKRLQEEGTLLVDVRPADAFGRSHIQGAVNIPLERLSEDIAVYLPIGEKVIVCCSSGECSAQAARLLASMGYTAYDLGGVDSWPYATGTGT